MTESGLVLSLQDTVSVAVACSRRHTVSIVGLLGRLRLLQARWNVRGRLDLAVALAIGAGRGVANILHARASVPSATQVT